MDSKILFGIYGASGFGREVMPILNENKHKFSNTNQDCELCFIESDPVAENLNGYPVISEKKFFSIDSKKKFFNIAISNSKIREALSKVMLSKGAKAISLISKNALVYDSNEIGEGAIVCANTIITSNAIIGAFFHSNIYSYVAHDCIIGDYVTFAPNVHCNGNVHIHDHAYIGTGAILKQGTQSKPLIIGKGAIVGMGAVVTKDVEPYSTVIGSPAKPMKK
ncbi:acetyltransferase [Gammaproteobacteria bacterium]|jgi:sugar O-acyltransferase (sialic acid O-acetyltransferase NeuD family)|nr:acetyltransferase [Gammaproteobacteria bacterium]